MQIPYIFNTVQGKSQLTVFLGGIPTEVDDTHPKFDEIYNNISTITPQEVRDLLDSSKAVRRALASFGNVKVDNGVVTYKGETVNGFLANRMIEMLQQGMDIRPWALFLENLKQNPAKHAVDELYGWLENANMPITERGNFLAYKKVNDDYTSYHKNPDGTHFHNGIGTFASMDRNKVDDDRTRTCSSGLHFCSWDYLGSYYGGSGKVVILEINPAHVVSIPTDYNNAKGRAEGYLIVGEIPQDQCKHAFPGLSYVSYDSSDYITWEQKGDIDYSDIEDGWYSNYDDDDEDFESECENAYIEGVEEGKCAATHNLSDTDYQLSGSDFSSDEAWYTYLDGFADGYYTHVAYIDQEDEEDLGDFVVANNYGVDVTIKSLADTINNDDVPLTLANAITRYTLDDWVIKEICNRLK